MTLQCPFCNSTIPIEDVNVSTDLALCRACGKTSKFSEIVQGVGVGNLDLPDLPPGAWATETLDGFRVGASTRSWSALFIIPFTCVWAGGSLGSIYGSQLKKGHIDSSDSLFGLPFLLGSCVLIAICAMTIAGKVEVSLAGERLTIFTGVGPLGWSRHFTWSDFYTAREDSRWGNGYSWNGRQRAVVLEGRRQASFGSMWSEARRYYVLRFMQRMLAQRSSRTGPGIVVKP